MTLPFDQRQTNQKQDTQTSLFAQPPQICHSRLATSIPLNHYVKSLSEARFTRFRLQMMLAPVTLKWSDDLDI